MVHNGTLGLMPKMFNAHKEQDISVVSMSNASLAQYPSNSLSKFTHVLPTPIVFDPKETYTICAKSFCISSVCEKGTSSPGYLKVYLHELGGYAPLTTGEDQCLLYVPYNEKNQLLWYTPDVETLCPIRSHASWRELNFLIKDEHNNQVKFGVGPPTIITLSIQKAEIMPQFQLSVSPAFSRDIFPSNNGSEFRAVLPSRIMLDNSWEVAVHSIFTPGEVMLSADFYFAIEQSGNMIFSQKEKDIGQTPKDLLSAFNKHLEKLKLRLKLFDSGYRLEPTQTEASFKDNQSLFIYLNAAACRRLNIRREKGEPHTKFDASHLIMKESSSAKLQDDRPDHFLLYCDIVRDSIVGNAKSPYLDIFPTNSLGLLHNDHDSFYPVKHLKFVPLKKCQFSYIHFALRDMQGKKLSFLPNTSSDMKFNLLFRSKQK